MPARGLLTPEQVRQAQAEVLAGIVNVEALRRQHEELMNHARRQNLNDSETDSLIKAHALQYELTFEHYKKLVVVDEQTNTETIQTETETTPLLPKDGDDGCFQLIKKTGVF